MNQLHETFAEIIEKRVNKFIFSSDDLKKMFPEKDSICNIPTFTNKDFSGSYFIYAKNAIVVLPYISMSGEKVSHALKSEFHTFNEEDYRDLLKTKVVYLNTLSLIKEVLLSKKDLKSEEEVSKKERLGYDSMIENELDEHIVMVPKKFKKSVGALLIKKDSNFDIIFFKEVVHTTTGKYFGKVSHQTVSKKDVPYLLSAEKEVKKILLSIEFILKKQRLRNILSKGEIK